MVNTPLFDLGSVGLVQDLPDHTLPPEAWTDMRNMRCIDGDVKKIEGDSQVFGTPTVAPSFVLGVPGASQTFWVYNSLTKAYVYEGGVHTNITRQTAGVDVNYTTVNGRDWNGCLFQGVPILNNGSDVPQYWSALSSSQKLQDLAAWPGATTKARVMRAFGSYLIALNVVDAGTPRPHMVWWSHKADPGSLPSSWNYADPTVDAGRRELTDAVAGVILDAQPLRNMMLIYKEGAVHTMRFQGGQEIFAFDILQTEGGVLATRCVTVIDEGKRHFFVSNDDLLVTDGQSTTSLGDRRLRRALFADIDPTYYVNSFCFHNPREKEAWFCYPASGSSVPNIALIWNYRSNTFYKRDFVGLAASSAPITEAVSDTWTSTSGDWSTETAPWSTEGRQRTVVASPDDTKFYLLDNTEQFHGTSFTAYLERTSLGVLGKGRDGKAKADYTTRKLVYRIWPKIRGTALVGIRLGGQESIGSAVTWSAEQSFDPATQTYLDFEVNGRLIGVRFATNLALSWRLEGYDLDIAPLGQH